MPGGVEGQRLRPLPIRLATGETRGGVKELTGKFGVDFC